MESKKAGFHDLHSLIPKLHLGMLIRAKFHFGDAELFTKHSFADIYVPKCNLGTSERVNTEKTFTESLCDPGVRNIRFSTGC